MNARQEPFRVFVVEDDVSDARMLAQLLREDGYDVEVAFDGAAAITRLAQAPTPHVLIVDYKLPHVDGLAIAGFARSRDASMEVVVITGYPDIVERAAVPAGGRLRAVLTKPLIYADLTAQLELARDAHAALARVS
jgi:two-component system response regulator MprA